MHNTESVVENDTHKILWDFEIQADYLISVRLPVQVTVKKKERISQNVDFGVLADHRVK